MTPWTLGQLRAALEPLLERLGAIHEVGDGPRDVGMRKLAVAGAAVLTSSEGQLADNYRWTAEESAFGTGLEGILQLQVGFALLSRPQPEPVVVRIVRGLASTSEAHLQGGILFLLISAEFVDVLSRLADAWAYALAWHRKLADDHGDNSDPEIDEYWTRSNVLGGRDLETLSRGWRLGFAYLAIGRFLTPSVTWRTLGNIIDDKIDHVHLVNEDALILGPVEYAMFHAWGSTLTLTAADDDTRFWKDLKADVHALDLFDRAHHPFDFEENKSRPTSNEAVISYSVYLQARRLHRFVTGVPELIRQFCVPAGEPTEPPRLGRLGRTEIQMRLVTIAPILDYVAEYSSHLLLGVNDEMQVFYGLVVARTLIDLGGTAYLGSLCGTDWTVVMDHLKDMGNQELGDAEVADIVGEIESSERDQTG